MYKKPSSQQSTTLKAKRDTSPIKGRLYQVQRGDTLFSISWRASLDLNRLASYNGLTSPYLIREGEILKLTPSQKINTVYTQKPIIKKQSASQNVQKNDKILCTGQSCTKKPTQVVVQRQVKEYPAAKVKVGEKIVKPITKITKPMSEPRPESMSETMVEPMSETMVEPMPETTPETADEPMSKDIDWQWPTEGKLTKTFANSQSGMKGISLASKRGTPVYTSASGEVVYAGSGLRGFGNLIIIKHNDDYLSAYAHNEQLLVREKQQVKNGQKIATMGDSGTDSVKLHFEIRYQGSSIDPLRYLPKR
ncbi:MAG: peptidoglycan DD-metalloendopeptidase family protein [Psychromonas sp.]